MRTTPRPAFAKCSLTIGSDTFCHSFLLETQFCKYKIQKVLNHSASFLLEPFSTEVQTWKTPTKGGFRDLWTFESPEAMITICLREEMRLKACAAFNPGFVHFNPFLARQQIVGYNKKYPVTYVTVVHTL